MYPDASSYVFEPVDRNKKKNISIVGHLSEQQSAYWINALLPVYSGKQMVNGEREIFSSNKSFLFKNKMIDVSTNHFELHIESNNFIDSIMRFISSSSANTKS